MTGEPLLLPQFLEAHSVAMDSTHIWRFPKQELALPLGEIVRRGADYAAALSALGVRAGERVGLVLENCAEYMSLLLGIWRVGAVAVPLPPGGGKFDMTGFLRGIEADCGFCLLIFEDELSRASIDECVPRDGKGLRKSELIRLSAEAFAGEPIDVAADDIALLQYSSGSTARPKGVIVTHAMLSAQVRQLDAEFRHACGGEALRSSGSWLPFHHDMGLFIGLLLPLFTRAHNLLGSPLYYMRDPKRWFRMQAEHGVNWNFTTNSVMASTLASLRLLDPTSVDLSRFYLYLAAEKVSPSVWRRTCEALERLGMPRDHVRIGYGLAENALGVASTKAGPVRCVHVRSEDETRFHLSEATDPEALELVSIGRAHVNTQINLRDPAGKLVPELTIGEICVRGPCVTPGYFADPVKSAEQIVDGELRTRDLGFWFEDELYFVARKDDVLVVGGRNIAPDDVEDCIESLEGVPVGGAVLFDVPVVASGKTELVLLVELHKRLSAEEAAARRALLRDHVLAERGILIHHVAFTKRNALEKTSSGKKRRKLMRERFVKRELELS